ncbi:hypothetical protein BGX34_000100 [Mortierella sp. NVP85]|nr:hypothetical protein BGX34_000100 [Mortierella sp. NVP85]
MAQSAVAAAKASTATQPTPSIPTAPVAPALASPTLNAGSSGSTRAPTAHVTLDGYKVHPSALSAPRDSSSSNLTAVAAVQRAAALAADDANIDPAEPPSDGSPSPTASCCVSIYSLFSCLFDCLFQPMMPILFTLIIGYIYYVYTFRVCIDYIIHIQHKLWQACKDTNGSEAGQGWGWKA